MTHSDVPIDAYLRFFENLHPETMSTLDDLVTPDVRFVDPFNNVRGPAAMRRIFEHMLATVVDPRFTVTHVAAKGNVCFARWRFFGYVRAFGRDPWRVEGVSEIHFDADGRVSAHIDHWDAAGQFYERLAVVGPLFRFIRRRAERR